MESVILKVVLILGIIIAGGFLLFFMADILMAIFNGKKDEKVVKANEAEDVKKVEKELSDQDLSKEEAAALVNGAVVEEYVPEETAIEETENAETTEETAETEEASEEDEESDEEETDDRDAYIEARRKALMERLAKMNEENADEDEESEEEESEEETEEDAEESEETEETEEGEETEEEEGDDVVDLDEDLDQSRQSLEEERAKPEALHAEAEDARREVTTVKVYLTEEEYESRLAVLNERLKVNEKELRQCKKEFFPLRKVKKTLESDERKLRRREALVAKQKVVLYGVNNYADIDEEKAKKLAEDLDLLDGLKLSVEHCQEVMAKNAERYPLLERIYNVLAEQNAQIKADIALAEQELAEVRGKKN